MAITNLFKEVLATMAVVCTDWELLEMALALGEECRIEGLTGDFRFLSNFFIAPIEVEGILFPSVEHAYQAAKTNSYAVKVAIAKLPTAGSAKRYGVEPRKGWELERLRTMESLVELKFRSHLELGQLLKRTGHAYIEETNTWNDQYWGVCNGVGENHLGHVLMRVRSRL